MQKPKTPAVLLLDEDIILSCDEIERGMFLLHKVDADIHFGLLIFFVFLHLLEQPFENGDSTLVDLLDSVLIII